MQRGHDALRIDEMLQDVEAEDRVERALELVEGLLDRHGVHAVVMRPGQLGLRFDDLYASEPRGSGCAEEDTHATGAAADVEHRADRAWEGVDDVVPRVRVVAVPLHAGRG